MVERGLARVSLVKLQTVSKEETEETRLEASLRLLSLPLLTLGSEDPKYTVAGPWGVPCLPESLGCVEAGWSCWSQPTATLQVSVFTLKQGQVQLLPHLVKIMSFFGVVQVSHGTRGPKPKGASVMWVLHSAFCNLLPPRHRTLPRHLCQSTLSELLSPAVMLYSVSKIQPWWPCWWEIILLSTLPCCTQTPAWSFMCTFLAWYLLWVNLTWICSSQDVSWHSRASSAVASHTVQLRPHHWRLEYFFVTFFVSELFPLFYLTIKTRTDKSQALISSKVGWDDLRWPFQPGILLF